MRSAACSFGFLDHPPREARHRPPQLVEEVIDSARSQRARDEWVKAKLATGKDKSSEIYGPSDPALAKELDDYIKMKTAKKDK
jgi:hypothetical protein